MAADDALRPLAPDLWVAERPMRALLFLDIGTRMSVVRTADGNLVLHSPVPADDATRRAVAALGPVRAILAPSRVHHLYAAEWKRAFPEASLLGAPGLAAKRKDLAFDGELGDAPHASFAGALEPCLVRGMPILNEVVFLHAASRSLLVSDLVFFVTPASRRGLRVWARISRVPRGRLAPNWVVRQCVRDRAAARAALDRVLRWDFDRVVVTHGEVLESGGRSGLREAWAWL